MTTNTNTPGLADFPPDGLFDGHELATRASRITEGLSPSNRTLGELFNIVRDSLGDPRVTERINETGREIILNSCEVTLRRARVDKFVDEAKRALVRERKEVKRFNAQMSSCRDEIEDHDDIVEADYQETEHALRASRLSKIIDLATTASGVLDMTNFFDGRIYDPDRFGKVPEALIEIMRRPHGLETFRRRMEYTDEVFARLHADFPTLMAELPSDLLLAEGPEGQPGRRAGAARNRGIMLKRKEPV